MREQVTTSRSRAIAAVAMGLFALACAGLAGDAFAARAGPPRPSYWGAWIGPQLTGAEPPADMSAVSRFERIVGKAPSLLELSVPFANCSTAPCYPIEFPAAQMQSVRDYGAIPFLSWSSFASSGEGHEPEFQLSRIIAGAYDSYIRGFAAAAREWGHPFFLRFDWEMNGGWFPWSEGVNGNRAGEYVAAWRHVHDIFTGVGATNATWVWCPYADPRRHFLPLAELYPGREYVDWTCVDVFNWGRNPTNPAPWMSFDQIFRSTYRRIVKAIAPDKPLLIGELGSSGPARARATWIRKMFRLLAVRYRRVRGLIWFDKVDRGVDWPLETSRAAVRAFSRGVGRAYRPNLYGGISESPIQPPPSASRHSPRG